MKIAKKVLAVVMALAMVGCFAAMAFADEVTPKFAFVDAKEVGEDDYAGYNKVILYCDDLVGLESVNMDVKANDAVAAVIVEDGDDPFNITVSKSKNTFVGAYNTDKLDDMKVGFMFKENLWSTKDWKAEKSKSQVNGEHFAAVTIWVKLAEGKTMADVSLEGKLTACKANGAEALDTKVVNLVAKTPVPPTTDAPTTDAPTTDVPSTDVPSTDVPSTDVTTTDATSTTVPGTTVPTQPDKPTGDTGMLAIAFGVVALAGAALVVAKKRK